MYGSTYTAQKNETVKKTGELSEAEEMELFKKEFYAEIDKIPKDRTIANVAINISENYKRQPVIHITVAERPTKTISSESALPGPLPTK